VLVCSSLGSELRGIDLGRVDLLQPSGGKVRTSVVFPFAPDERFIVVERDGFAAIIHRDLPIDATTEVRNVSFAITSNSVQSVLTSRGHLKDSWLLPLPKGTQRTLIDEDYVVAIVSSSRHYLQAVAAVPNANMKSALQRNQFFVEYQPIVELQTKRWVGAEVLIRWRRMKGEIVGPDRFIPVVEESGLSQWISRRVVDLVAVDAKDFFRQHPEFHLAINLTAADLHDAGTVDMLRGLAAATGARRGNLRVEATERLLTEAEVANEVVRALRADGVSVAIDDFGTGYSSLSYLERLDVDTLKIDKAFVDTLNRDAVTSNVVIHIIEMAKALGKAMIAEGVECQAQADFLRDLGVQYAQGWHFSKPLSFEKLKAELEARRLAKQDA
jgi:sensor c-di-GMP phosphodiesterase-like protein